MRCILEGHRPRQFDGHGPYQGQKFFVCIDCGKTEPYSDNGPSMIIAPQPLLSERQESRN